MMSALPTNTSERILEASLKLFNEYGFQNVPVLRIATHMGISSGNLAYHFKTKTDIVLAVFPLLEKALRDTKQREGPFLPSSAALHQIEVFHTLWRYRFFFNALTKLLSEDAELHRRFMRLQDTVITAMQELFDELIQQKYMYPVKPPNSTRLLAKLDPQSSFRIYRTTQADARVAQLALKFIFWKVKARWVEFAIQRHETISGRWSSPAYTTPWDLLRLRWPLRILHAPFTRSRFTCWLPSASGFSEIPSAKSRRARTRFPRPTAKW